MCISFIHVLGVIDMITVTAGIIEKGDLVLIARRKAGKHLEGYWEFPGGKIEGDEAPEDCLKRELKEEFSIDTIIHEFVGESIYEYSNKTIRLLAFRTEAISDEFDLIDHDKIVWVSLNEIKNYQIAPADLPLIEQYAELRNSK